MTRAARRRPLPDYRMPPLSDDPTRPRSRPGLGIAERWASRSQGAEVKARGATLTFAQRAFAGAELRASWSVANCGLRSEMTQP